MSKPGVRAYGRGHLADKQILILDSARYRYQQFLSDIAGQDIADHENTPELAIERVRSWLNSIREQAPPLKGPARIYALYRDFASELPQLAVSISLDPQCLDFNDFCHFAGAWIELKA